MLSLKQFKQFLIDLKWYLSDFKYLILSNSPNISVYNSSDLYNLCDLHKYEKVNFLKRI